MIDNLQRYYLARLETAQQHAIDGNVFQCVDICFELRLKSDLALFTRAHVNLMLADLTNIHEHPNKSKFAREALRLAIELKEDDEQSKTPFWFAQYDKLETDARLTLERAEEQERQLAEMNRSPSVGNLQDTPMEEGIDSLSLEEAVEPWEIEGCFSVRWPPRASRDSEQTSDVAMTEEDGDIVGELPTLPQQGPGFLKRHSTTLIPKEGLPTPAGSEL